MSMPWDEESAQKDARREKMRKKIRGALKEFSEPKQYCPIYYSWAELDGLCERARLDLEDLAPRVHQMMHTIDGLGAYSRLLEDKLQWLFEEALDEAFAEDHAEEMDEIRAILKEKVVR